MRTFLLILAFTFSTHAYAQGKGSLPKADDTIKAIGVIKLRDASPDPTFGSKGKQIGWLKEGEQAKVISAKRYIGILGTEVWLEVAKEGTPVVKGWILAGLEQDLANGHSTIELVNAELPARDEQRAPSRAADALVQNQ
jgi:hypothetical protein